MTERILKKREELTKEEIETAERQPFYYNPSAEDLEMFVNTFVSSERAHEYNGKRIESWNPNTWDTDKSGEDFGILLEETKNTEGYIPDAEKMLQNNLDYAKARVAELRKTMKDARQAYALLMAENRELLGRLEEKDLEDNFREMARGTGVRRDSKEGPYYDVVPPHNPSAEMVLLGTLINHPEARKEVNLKYLYLALYKIAHQDICNGIIALGSKLDLTTLQDWLAAKGVLEKVGGRFYLQELVQEAKNSGKPENVSEYFRQVENCFLRREIIVYSKTLCRDAAYERNPDEKVPSPNQSMTEWIRVKAMELARLIPFRFQKSRDAASGVEAVIDDFDKLVERKGKPDISTGYHGVDRITHGVRGHRLIMCGASTKQGKTTLVLNIADKLSAQGKSSLFFTYESSISELVEKLIAKRAGIDTERFRYWDVESGNLSQEEIERIKLASEEVKKLQIEFDSNKPDIEYIVARSHELKVMNPNLHLVVVDGLQSFAGYVPYQGNKSDIYYEVLKRLKRDVAETLGVDVLVNAQLKLEVLKRKNKKPRGIEDFSDCKGIPEVADAAFMLYRPEEYWPDNPEFSGWISIIPGVLRIGDKRKKGAKLLCDMKTARIWEEKQE
ncbi:hypothetical protein HYW76_01125 [Candidatus Pacearchaeota archaeon]|nr:hypothetical protein [Candidatus Pacearchaeota archaeon]